MGRQLHDIVLARMPGVRGDQLVVLNGSWGQESINVMCDLDC